VWAERDIAPLLSLREVRLYTVEVCTECSWNHLRTQLTYANGRAQSGRRRRGRAST